MWNEGSIRGKGNSSQGLHALMIYVFNMRARCIFLNFSTLALTLQARGCRRPLKCLDSESQDVTHTQPLPQVQTQFLPKQDVRNIKRQLKLLR